LVGGSINDDPLYWESEVKEDNIKNGVEYQETITRTQSPTRKIITRNVGNTKRRLFK
jgi:hypothetical protein